MHLLKGGSVSFSVTLHQLSAERRRCGWWGVKALRLLNPLRRESYLPSVRLARLCIQWSCSGLISWIFGNQQKCVVNASLKAPGLVSVLGCFRRSVWSFAPAQIQSAVRRSSLPSECLPLTFCTENTGLCFISSTYINQNWVCLFLYFTLISMLFLFSYVQKYAYKWVYVNLCIISAHENHPQIRFGR